MTVTVTELEAAVRARVRRAVIAVAAALVVAGAVVGWLAVRGPNGEPTPATDSATTRKPAATAAAPAAPAPSAIPPASALVGQPGTTAYVAPQRWVPLPRARGAVDEYPVGFDHTGEGAVALTVHMAEYGWTLDPAEFTRVAAVYTDPAHIGRVVAQAEQATRAWRTTLGLAATGPLPATAGMSVHPTGVAWTQLTRDRVRVSVLAEVTAHYGNGQRDRIWPVAVTADTVWVDVVGDWRVSVSQGPLPTPAPARLGTGEFNTAGWVAISEERP